MKANLITFQNAKPAGGPGFCAFLLFASLISISSSAGARYGGGEGSGSIDQPGDLPFQEENENSKNCKVTLFMNGDRGCISTKGTGTGLMQDESGRYIPINQR